LVSVIPHSYGVLQFRPLPGQSNEGLKDPDITRKLEEPGPVPVGGAPSEMTAQLTRQAREMTELASQIGIRPE
jgi:hypothetical protein